MINTHSTLRKLYNLFVAFYFQAISYNCMANIFFFSWWWTQKALLISFTIKKNVLNAPQNLYFVFQFSNLSPSLPAVLFYIILLLLVKSTFTPIFWESPLIPLPLHFSFYWLNWSAAWLSLYLPWYTIRSLGKQLSLVHLWIPNIWQTLLHNK